MKSFFPTVILSSLYAVGYLQAGTIIVNSDLEVVFTGQQENFLQIGEAGTEIRMSSLSIGGDVGQYQSALAVGEYASVLADNAVALGGGRAYAPGSVTLAGGRTFASWSVAMMGGTASADSSLAILDGDAYAENSVAIGQFATTFGRSSLVLGRWGVSYGQNSVSMLGSTTHGDDSLAVGRGVQSVGRSTIFMGRYNALGLPEGEDASSYSSDPHPEGYLFVIGNGTGQNRSNALVIYENGDADLNGDVTVSGKLNVQELEVAGEPVLTESSTGNYLKANYNRSFEIGEYNAGHLSASNTLRIGDTLNNAFETVTNILSVGGDNIIWDTRNASVSGEKHMIKGAVNSLVSGSSNIIPWIDENGSRVLSENVSLLGEHLTSTTNNSTTVGQYNAPSDGLFVVGNGSGPEEESRSNALVIYENGDADLNGSLTAESLHINGSPALTEQSFTTNHLPQITAGITTARGTLATSGAILAIGENSSASAKGAIALGEDSSVSGHDAIALGFKANAEGRQSFAAGRSSETFGHHATALGHLAKGVSRYSLAIGQNPIAYSQYSIAIGHGSRAGEDNGSDFSKADEYTSPYNLHNAPRNQIAIGRVSKAKGNNTIALGYSADAIEDFSIAIGSNAQATNESAVAIGNETNSSGLSSFATGNLTKAEGDFSSTFNMDTQAIGHSSAAFGRSTIASTASQFVVGEYNEVTTGDTTLPADSDALFVVGNGSGPEEENRSNALEVHRDGTIIISKPQGDISMGIFGE